ncbi:transposase domain-containing protein [Streptomyces sp. NPDC088353]|uniref:transposase domain-containing protein n=1 Tax=Streptomyces sp. NPDC088353 TaxID=3365855 RepID=UPI00381825B6
MAQGVGGVGLEGRLTDLVSLGALTSLVPRSVLDEAIAVTEAYEQRVRKLPAHVVVYLLMALCLYADDDYEEVAEKLTGMLSYLPGSRWQAPTRGAITQARQRLGPEPVKEAFVQVARPAATPATRHRPGKPRY